MQTSRLADNQDHPNDIRSLEGDLGIDYYRPIVSFQSS